MKEQQFASCLIAVALSALTVGCATRSATQEPSAAPVATSLAPLPEKVTSFGAVTVDGWLYAFGGHKGERHDYSVDKVSGTFQRLNLSEGRTWEPLPPSTPGQGQPLVGHNGYVYRIGGMAARNSPDTKQDLYSLTIAQRFDPRKKSWEDIPALPAPRSSHDAVVMGDKLYVIGGWQLYGGTNKPVWPGNGLVLDLKNSRAGWKEFPQPFQRRALAVASNGAEIYCIGGMDSDNKSTLAVEVYNIKTGQWSKGPELPQGKQRGFACSAISQAGRVYVTAFKGDLLRLSTDGSAWDVVGKLEHPRMAHRLVTAGGTKLIALGGEDGEEKRPDLELLTPSAAPQAASQTAAAQN